MKKNGFTIVELLLYMGIFSVLVAVLGNIFLSLMDQQLNTQSNTEVTQNLNYIFSRFSHDVYAASSIALPASAGQSGSTLTIVIGGQNNTYSLDSNKNLVLTNSSGSYVLNTPDVSITNFTATRLGTVGKANVHIGLTITSNITPFGKPAQTVSFSDAFTLR